MVLVSLSGSSPPITAYTSPVTPRSEGVTGGALSVAACAHFLRPKASRDFTLASSCDFRGGARAGRASQTTVSQERTNEGAANPGILSVECTPSHAMKGASERDARLNPDRFE